MRIAASLLVLGLIVLTAARCDGGSPCGTCPKVEGTYALTYKAASSESPDCASIPAPPGPARLEITRAGAVLRASLNGAPGQGLLQETLDFSISAVEEPDGGTDGGSQQTVMLRGYFVAPVVKGDGGEPGALIGKWVTHTERGAKFCDAERQATGVKQ